MIAVVMFWGNLHAGAQPDTDFAAWKNPLNVDAIPEWTRIMLTRDFRNRSGTDREELLAKTLAGLKDIVADNQVLPATRYNAILAVGQLELEPGNPPKAYQEALLYLIEVYEHDPAITPLFLKYGAMLGIVRHAVCGIEPDHLDKVIDLLLHTVEAEHANHPAGMEESDIWLWFRLAALDGITALKTTGTDGKVIQTILTLIRKKTAEIEYLSEHDDLSLTANYQRLFKSIELASKAAKTLGDLDFNRMNTESDADIPCKDIADSFIILTKTVYNACLKMISPYLPQNSVEQNTIGYDHTDTEGGIAENTNGQIDTVGLGNAESSREILEKPNGLTEQIVVNLKTCMQSVVWGVRSGFLSQTRPAEHSFYVFLDTDSPEIKRMDMLMAVILELSAFLDEGDRSRRPLGSGDAPKTFPFHLHELNDVLNRASEKLATDDI